MAAAAEKLKTFNRRYINWIVGLLRVAVGGLFVMSGLVKGIDIWGFAFKIQEYFTVWHFQLTHSLYVAIAVALSLAEFIGGLMLLLGCYRRISVWLLTAMMAVMLPLTLYIFVADPVADCGCFGDFWVLSNGATFFKNLLITAALVYLIVYNRKVRGLVSPLIQWTAAAAGTLYLLIIAVVGYIVQPLADFRSFPEGTSLIETAADSLDSPIEFVYEKNGEESVFTEDNLPDSTWTFVERRDPAGASSKSVGESSLVLYDGDEDVTEDAIPEEGKLMIITVPDFDRANIAYTYTVNELQRIVNAVGGELIEVVPADSARLEYWRDMSMASYPIYEADGTTIKELARGEMAAVYVEDGVVSWKRSLSSIDTESLQQIKSPQAAIDSLRFNGGKLFGWLTFLLALFLLVVILLDNSIVILWRRRLRRLLKERQKTEDSGESAEKNE